jgi:RNA polymerase sigma-70 factor (ECF subfamily)
MHADQFAEEQNARGANDLSSAADDGSSAADEQSSARPEALSGESGKVRDRDNIPDPPALPLSAPAFIPHPSKLRKYPGGAFIEKSGNAAALATTSGTNSDEALLLLYRDGDERGFLAIYDRYKSNIYAYCAHVLFGAGCTTELVEDTFQEIFMRVAQYQHTFTGGEFSKWIFTIARHTCLTNKKRAFRHRATTEYIGDGENFAENASIDLRRAFSINDDPLDRMTKTERTDFLLKAIASLPEEFREALIMSEYEGLTYEEIGKLTGTSLSTIRIRVYRAKTRLRKMLLPILGDETDQLINLPEPDEKPGKKKTRKKQ